MLHYSSIPYRNKEMPEQRVTERNNREVYLAENGSRFADENSTNYKHIFAGLKRKVSLVFFKISIARAVLFS